MHAHPHAHARAHTHLSSIVQVCCEAAGGASPVGDSWQQTNKPSPHFRASPFTKHPFDCLNDGLSQCLLPPARLEVEDIHVIQVLGAIEAGVAVANGTRCVATRGAELQLAVLRCSTRHAPARGAAGPSLRCSVLHCASARQLQRACCGARGRGLSPVRPSQSDAPRVRPHMHARSAVARSSARWGPRTRASSWG